MTLQKPAILITAGPTREYIDRVRFISNASSGKMGLTMAQEAIKQKLSTTIISGPVCRFENFPGSKIINVKTTAEMFSTVKKLIKNYDIFISSAAVADYRPSEIIIGKRKILLSSNFSAIPLKIKKTSPTLNIKLTQTPDILRSISKITSTKKRPAVIVGFALENAKNLIKDAREKLQNKKCDFVVANQLSAMESDKTSGAIVYSDGKIHKFHLLPKKLLARKIIKDAIKIWQQKNQ